MADKEVLSDVTRLDLPTGQWRSSKGAGVALDTAPDAYLANIVAQLRRTGHGETPKCQEIVAELAKREQAARDAEPPVEDL